MLIKFSFWDTALTDAIREDISVLTLLAEVLCLLDMIVNSFAHMVSTKPVGQYTRPQFTGMFLVGLHDYLSSKSVRLRKCLTGSIK